MGDAYPVAVELLGHPYEVVCSDAEVAAAVRATFADLVSGQARSGAKRLHLDGPPGPETLTRLADTLRETARGLAGGCLLPRAGAVAHADGSVAILCGDPRTGTTTLLAALLERGWAYLTDETLVLDPGTLEVRPVREPLSLEGSLVPSGSLTTAAVPGEPLETRLLVVPHYDARLVGVDVTRLTGGEVVHVAGMASSRLGEVDGGPLPALARLARRVPAYRLRYADPRLAAEEVLRLWRESVRPVARAVTLPTGDVEDAMRDLVAAGVVDLADEAETGYRRPAHVGVAHDGDLIVLLDLRDGERRVLSPTAAAVWEAVTGTSSLQAAVAELQDAFPDATGLAEDTERFVAELEAQGLVERG